MYTDRKRRRFSRHVIDHRPKGAGKTTRDGRQNEHPAPMARKTICERRSLSNPRLRFRPVTPERGEDGGAAAPRCIHMNHKSSERQSAPAPAMDRSRRGLFRPFQLTISVPFRICDPRLLGWQGPQDPFLTHGSLPPFESAPRPSPSYARVFSKE